LDDSRLRSLKRRKDRSGRLQKPFEHGYTTTLAFEGESVGGYLRVVQSVTCRKPLIECEDSDQMFVNWKDHTQLTRSSDHITKRK
jgi:hypothetical protein